MKNLLLAISLLFPTIGYTESAAPEVTLTTKNMCETFADLSFTFTSNKLQGADLEEQISHLRGTYTKHPEIAIYEPGALLILNNIYNGPAAEIDIKNFATEVSDFAMGTYISCMHVEAAGWVDESSDLLTIEEPAPTVERETHSF